MKHTLIVATVLAAGIAPSGILSAQGSNDESAAAKSLLQTEHEWTRAIRTGDKSTLKRIPAPDFKDIA